MPCGGGTGGKDDIGGPMLHCIDVGIPLDVGIPIGGMAFGII